MLTVFKCETQLTSSLRKEPTTNVIGSVALLILYHGLPFRAILKEISLKYEKTINFGSTTSNPKIVSHGITNIKYFIEAHAIGYNESEYGWHILPRIDKDGLQYGNNIRITTTEIHYAGGSQVQNYSNIFITLRYVKNS